MGVGQCGHREWVGLLELQTLGAGRVEGVGGLKFGHLLDADVFAVSE